MVSDEQGGFSPLLTKPSLTSQPRPSEDGVDMNRAIRQYHPAEAEALACFELKLSTVMEHYFRALRERIVGLTERDGTLPVTFWMCERDTLARLLSPVYEAGIRLGMELERPPRAAFISFINLNTGLQTTIQRLAGEVAQEITVSAARRLGDLLNMGLNPKGLPERLRHELRDGVLSDSHAQQMACGQAERVIAAGKLLVTPPRPIERILPLEYELERVCI